VSMGRVSLVALAALLAVPAAARAEQGSGPPATPLECMPTSVWSFVPAGSGEPTAGPELAVVRTDVRPDHTRLYLDGRFIGMADDFDGYPDVLYLRPGRYRLECRLGGYQTALFDIDSKAGCRFELRQRMERIPGTPKEHSWTHPKEPVAGGRVFGPLAAEPPARGGGGEARRRGGPDLALRPDIAREEEARERSSLRLTVEPPTAAVYLDGAFVGTGGELSHSARPLSVAAGSHRLEAMAPGFRTFRQEVELPAAAGEPGTTLSIVLEKEPDAQP
jgi:hypothetical protein